MSGIVRQLVVVAAAILAAVAILNDDRGVPLAAVIVVVLMILFTFITERTRYGRHIFAVGGNEEAARRAGINVNRIKISVFTLASMLAAAGGILAASRLLAVNQQSGSGDVLLLAIAGPVIAGTSLFGGRGYVWSALLGAVVIGSISNGMDLLALDSDVKFMITGAVLLAAVTIDAVTRRRREAAALTDASRLRFAVGDPERPRVRRPGRCWLELGRDAEAAGWDGFFVWDHLAYQRARDPGRRPVDGDRRGRRDAPSAIRLGVMVCALARRRPWKVARETASLDRLCERAAGLRRRPRLGARDASSPPSARTPTRGCGPARLDEGLDDRRRPLERRAVRAPRRALRGRRGDLPADAGAAPADPGLDRGPLAGAPGRFGAPRAGTASFAIHAKSARPRR